VTRLAEIEGHIGSMRELLDLVGAMRSLAGMRIQEAQRTLPGIRRYADSLAAAIADTLLLMPGSEAPARASSRQGLALILCTAEHGFVGGFNQRLADAAEAVLRTDDLLFVLGSRGAVQMLERGRRATWMHAMATRCSATSEIVRRLSTELYRRIAAGEIVRLETIYARYQQGAPSTVERRQLFPLDSSFLKAGQRRQPPLHNLEPVVLHEKLTGEYIIALLTEAVVESIASENVARVIAMEAAQENVRKKLERLRQQAWQARQTEITTELIELVAGFEAQSGR
jgi:F-type H+-transporting ATPase subunit gamma